MRGNAGQEEGQYRRFKWFTLTAITLVVAPTIAFQLPAIVVKGASNPYCAALAFVYLPVSFLCWQISLIFLYRSGKVVARRNLRHAMILSVSYVAVLLTAVALFNVYPASFY